MTEEKYHKQVYFQSGMEDYIRAIIASMTFYPSRHFQTAILRRNLPFPKKSQLMTGDIFEYTIIDGKLEKFCVRLHLTDVLHYCYSITVNGTIVTGWKNRAEDLHFTLQRGKYIENKEPKTGEQNR